jgi:hypothetical protein
MTNIDTFAGLLSQSATNIEEPKVLPPGKYLCVVDRNYEHLQVGNKNTDCVDFTLVPHQAIDVDARFLDEALNGAPLSSKKISYRMFVTQDSAYRLKKFLQEDLGVPLTTLGQMLTEIGGRQVIVTLAHRSPPDSTRVFQDVKKTERA